MNILVDFACRLPVTITQLTKFYNDHWNREIALGIPDFFEWQFLKPPGNYGKNYCVVAYDETHQQIAGIMGLHRRNFWLSTKYIHAAELTTWLVSPQYQGLGLGQRIIEKIKSEFDLALGMGITQQALPIYLKNGFRYLKNIPRFIKVFRFDKVSPYAEIQPYASKMNYLSLSKKEKQNYSISRTLPKFLPSSVYHASRAQADMQWRYKDHPIFAYQIFTIQSDFDTQALVVIRLEQNIPNLNIAHIIDFIAEDDHAYRSALSFLDDYAQECHIDVMDFYCTCASVNKFFLSAGWFSSVDDDCFQFPHLFHPLELRRPSTTSLIYWAKSKYLFEKVSDFGKLYITKQDMDFDRPTAQTYLQIRSGGNK